MPQSQLERFVKIVYQLRRKCPWDRKQTHRSLVRYLVEEAYETIAAIESGEAAALREELGDLLLQVVLHAEIAREQEGFGIEDVARGIAEKMIRRHPHVFGNEKAKSDPRGHDRRWSQLKAKEKPGRGLLEGIPRALPGLALGQRYGEIASSVGFDWSKPSQVLAKVREEIDELEVELGRRRRSRARIEAELGDLLFSLANLARHLGIDGDACARKGALKFGSRFEKMERIARGEGVKLDDRGAAELEALWKRVKRRGGVSPGSTRGTSARSVRVRRAARSGAGRRSRA